MWVVCTSALKVPETKIVDFANSVDPDQVAHNEPPHLDLHCFVVFEFSLFSSNFIIYYFGILLFEKCITYNSK